MECEEMTVEDKERLRFIRKQKLQVIKNIESLKLELHDITNQIESLGFPVECDDVTTRRRIIGCKEFNTSPKQGLEYLFEHNVVKKTPESVASFFLEEKDRLSKFAVGTYLGEIRKDFNMQVLDSFTRLHDFRNQDFLSSLRRFLLSFQLPGESQKIDRILTSFAERYLEQNPQSFHSAHEVYVLAYAAILLNTTLHNTNAKGQTLGLAEEKTFVRTLRDYDGETDIPEELIRKVYHNIKNEPIQPASDEGLGFFNHNSKTLTSGWLLKLGGRVRSWKRRWFVLTEESLLYYMTSDPHRHIKGAVALDGLSVRTYHDRTKEHTFELFSFGNGVIKASKADRDGATTPGHHTAYRFAASSIAERDRWVRALEAVTRRISERRGTRSISVDCSTNGSVHLRQTHRLPSPVASAASSLRRSNSAGSHPDLSSQQSILK
ncbi:unnamed protein product [Dicrocoelium dendriticum]|nr:unnamed protein product [Dicrocoelium dendriticum]